MSDFQVIASNALRDIIARFQDWSVLQDPAFLDIIALVEQTLQPLWMVLLEMFVLWVTTVQRDHQQVLYFFFI